ncbi:probable UDP-sugar transporter protein SLC35A4 [Asterias rubens]|uniref:probable UDP-sugar transporter protein SLC35A4 n=1 Tax=Asterias rubens TaxID=7604 RepID=UPI0014557929|nr:probable UDP-sugar transporter protein SLC35A4 [Asterias rubens]
MGVRVREKPQLVMKAKEKITWIALLAVGVLIYGSHSILLNLCKVDGKIPFQSTSVVVMIEAVKLVLSLMMYFGATHQPPSPMLNQRSKDHQSWTWVNSLLYAMPAVLYGINNNIIVHVPDHMDPASSQVLGNMKIVTTAVFYRLIFKKKFAWRQWFAVSLLAVAGMCYSGAEVQQSSTGSHNTREVFVTFTGILLMAVYCIVSGAAGITTEFILKWHSQSSLHLQNLHLYLYGVTFNLVAFYYSTWGSSEVRFFDGYSTWTFVIIISQAVIGLIMSVIMKHGSNILRLFVISCAMVVNTVLSKLVFSLQPGIDFWLAFVLVLLALYLYYNQKS